MDKYDNYNKNELINIMKVRIRAGNWTEARTIGEYIRQNFREPATKEGDTTLLV